MCAVYCVVMSKKSTFPSISVLLLVLPIGLVSLYVVDFTYFMPPSNSKVTALELSNYLSLVNASDIPERVASRLYAGQYSPTRVTKLSPCMPFLVYDKPPKTGSSAVTQALKEMLRERVNWNNKNFAVGNASRSAEVMEHLCKTNANRLHMLQHLSGTDGRIECMKRKGYYALTSIREPKERWRSAFRYNRLVKGNHYGVMWNASYETFMSNIPRCTLLWYYDGEDQFCSDEERVNERIRNIVGRYDEIIQLGVKQEKGQVESMLGEFLKPTNVSPKTEEGDDVEDERIKFEKQLYNALLERRKELIQRPTGSFCVPDVETHLSLGSLNVYVYSMLQKISAMGLGRLNDH